MQACQAPHVTFVLFAKLCQPTLHHVTFVFKPLPARTPCVASSPSAACHMLQAFASPNIAQSHNGLCSHGFRHIGGHVIAGEPPANTEIPFYNLLRVRAHAPKKDTTVATHKAGLIFHLDNELFSVSGCLTNIFRLILLRSCKCMISFSMSTPHDLMMTSRT